jgi:uncharacterized protein (TIGR02145 family)
MTVNPLLPVSVTIAASANPVCAGTTETFTATPVNGGTTPAYQWKVNGTNVTGATNVTYSYVPINGNAITCVLTSNATCPTGNPATSTAITMTVNPLLPVSVTVAASANPVCAGTSVIFTAIPVNGGTIPAYQWKVNGTNVTGATNATYSFIPVDGNTVSCILTSNENCTGGNPATSNTITMEVNANSGLIVSVSVEASANPVCAGTSVTFTATPVNGGTTPAYQWKVNGSNVSGATNVTYSFVPANSNLVTCILTSSETCPSGNPDTSNTVTMTVNPLLPVSVTIAASPNDTVCAGATVTYTATPTNGGTTPAYQWKVNGTIVPGATNSTYSFIPSNLNAITCVLTSNATCISGNPATSNTVTMKVNPLLPVSVTIAASANPVCAGTSVTFTATPVNGGTTPAYQWRVNGTNVTGATNVTYAFIPSNGNAIACIVTSNANCTSGNPDTSNTVTMTINPLLPVSVTISASANPVVPLTQVTFTATLINPGSAPTYQWKVNGVNAGTGNPFLYTPINSCTVSCVATSSETCTSGNPATSNTINMVVNFGVSCPGLPSVSYGGKSYNTVQIGGQCWFKENLDIGNMILKGQTPANNATIEKYCYNDLAANCDIYGGMYEWNEMMQYSSTEGVQGICPSGWHIPTEAEFATLSAYLGGDLVSGGKVKETGTSHFYTPNTGATNASGFTALPGGNLYTNSSFGSLYGYGYFNSSTTSTQDPLWSVCRSVSYINAKIAIMTSFKNTSMSVRCLKNN